MRGVSHEGNRTAMKISASDIVIFLRALPIARAARLVAGFEVDEVMAVADVDAFVFDLAKFLVVKR